MTKQDDEVEEKDTNYTIGPLGERVYGEVKPIDTKELQTLSIELGDTTKKVLEMLKLGKTREQIASELACCKQNVAYHIRKLKDLGMLENGIIIHRKTKPKPLSAVQEVAAIRDAYETKEKYEEKKIRIILPSGVKIEVAKLDDSVAAFVNKLRIR